MIGKEVTLKLFLENKVFGRKTGSEVRDVKIMLYKEWMDRARVTKDSLLDEWQTLWGREIWG